MMRSEPEARPLKPSMMLIALATPPMAKPVKSTAHEVERQQPVHPGQIDLVHGVAGEEREDHPPAHGRQQPVAHADLAGQVLAQPGEERQRPGEADQRPGARAGPPGSAGQTSA